jgi:allantoicase
MKRRWRVGGESSVRSEAPDVASAKAAAAVQFDLDEIQRNRIMRRNSSLLSTLHFIGAFRRRRNVSIQVDEVQSVPDGFGFHLKASEYTWVTLVFETKGEAEAAHGHAAKAVAHAKALKIVNR